jgi:hypothetical protein
LKPYETRVRATYHLLKAIIETINASPHKLRSAVRHADEATVRAGGVQESRIFLPVRFGIGERAGMCRFLGVRTRTEFSEVSGAERRIYSDEPVELTVPFFDEVTVVDSVAVPRAYLVPQEWSFVPQVMKAHGIVMERLTEAVTVEVESYRFSAVKWRERSFEGRHGPTYEVEPIRGRRTYPAGTVLIRTAQRTAKVVMHLLEPKSPDSFVAWGFFNSIFEQKEYAEPYVMEEIARKMLIEDPSLKQEFESRVKSDTVFARSPGARLNWLYLRSEWADPLLNTYPVARLVTPGELRSRVLD